MTESETTPTERNGDSEGRQFLEVLERASEMDGIEEALPDEDDPIAEEERNYNNELLTITLSGERRREWASVVQYAAVAALAEGDYETRQQALEMLQALA